MKKAFYLVVILLFSLSRSAYAQSSECTKSISELPSIFGVRLLMKEPEFAKIGLGLKDQSFPWMSKRGQKFYESTSSIDERDAIHAVSFLDGAVEEIQFSYNSIKFKTAQLMSESVANTLSIPKSGWSQINGWGKNSLKLSCDDFYIIISTGIEGNKIGNPHFFLTSINLEKELTKRASAEK